MPARIHVSRAPQVLDPCRVQNQKAVPDGHRRERISLAGISAARHWDVFLYFHAYSLQQIHENRNPNPKFPFQPPVPHVLAFLYTFFTSSVLLNSRKKSRARILCDYVITLLNISVITCNLLISLSYYTITT